MRSKNQYSSVQHDKLEEWLPTIFDRFSHSDLLLHTLLLVVSFYTALSRSKLVWFSSAQMTIIRPIPISLLPRLLHQVQAAFHSRLAILLLFFKDSKLDLKRVY